MVSCNRLATVGGLVVALAGCAPAAPSGRVVPIRGIRMYFVTCGRRQPLLLIHGGAGNGDQFSKQIPAFAAHHRLIIPDCRA